MESDYNNLVDHVLDNIAHDENMEKIFQEN